MLAKEAAEVEEIMAVAAERISSCRTHT